MCGIVGAVAERNITAILVEGLKRLEYRGYDSAGVAVLDNDGGLQRRRRVGKVSELEQALVEQPLAGRLGIAHTRWATHGAPTEHNAHPHFSGDLALVHNGIIENHEALRARLKGSATHSPPTPTPKSSSTCCTTPSRRPATWPSPSRPSSRSCTAPTAWR